MMLLGGFAAAALAFWVVAPVLIAPRPVAGPVCPNCGPRPEADARFCSNCGAAILR